MINGVCNTNGDALLYLHKLSCIKVGEETTTGACSQLICLGWREGSRR